MKDRQLVVCSCGQDVTHLGDKVMFSHRVAQFKCALCGLFDVWLD